MPLTDPQGTNGPGIPYDAQLRQQLESQKQYADKQLSGLIAGGSAQCCSPMQPRDEVRRILETRIAYHYRVAHNLAGLLAALPGNMGGVAEQALLDILENAH